MDSNAKELSALLDTFGLFQHVKGPTHTRGHTLVISKGVNISSVDVKEYQCKVYGGYSYVTNCECRVS